ncbi:unnamed protein product [Bursaphelenchus xylophilus]|uniref:(pine wood nematode) hypothetical protein n=1 Tax=Bursaphelenchus xylophilus TaxID=6326 RepID=A0A1I7SUX7_BURXY|nr:unnamed protein product [Bursaphelenchus xylophilus]CAG9125773.1 unnamed protein product [Bursaphelenchus xylophilus]
MSRWELNTLGRTRPLQPVRNDAVSMSQNVLGLEREVYQHGTVGDFLGSSLEGVQSGFIKCVYTAKHQPNNTVTLLCEKAEGCCRDWCCPKDQFWMTGVFVLLGFVLLVFIIGACAIIICYQRSKIRQRREEKEVYEYVESQLSNYPVGSTQSIMGPMTTEGPTMGYSTYNNHAHRY